MFFYVIVLMVQKRVKVHRKHTDHVVPFSLEYYPRFIEFMEHVQRKIQSNKAENTFF
jgi:hypothetical protein